MVHYLPVNSFESFLYNKISLNCSIACPVWKYYFDGILENNSMSEFDVKKSKYILT